MPILQWLFKASTTVSTNKRKHCTIEEEEEEEEEEEVKSRDLVVYNEGGTDEREVQTKKTFTILLRREDSRECFYSTLQLTRLNILNYEREQYFWPRSGGFVGMGHKAESVAVGCKVLPICNAASMGSSSADSNDGLEKEVQKRRKATSRMKELLRWAAAAKSNKGGIKGWKVLYFKNKLSLKDPLDDTSSNSSKISFRWDVGSCTTSSSVYSPLSLPSTTSRSDQMWTKNLSAPSVNHQSTDSNASSLDSPKTEGCDKAGQWITTDSDFVVLEL